MKIDKKKAEAAIKHIEASTQKEIKKEHKFNVKAWLIASIFSITSCLIGIANMIIHFVDKH